MRIPPESWARAHDLVRERLGLEIPDHRRADLEEALLESTREARLRSPEELLARLTSLAEDGSEWRSLAQRLTIGETYFFRDRAAFEALEHTILPRLAEARRTRERRLRLSLWSAGCSTGEEAYSLATLLDAVLPDASAWEVTILGTDINPAALEAARRGVYRPWSLRDTPPAIRERYFERRREGYAVLPEIRDRVRFARLNLGTDDPLPANVAPVDVILCRNVLMYLTRAVARRVVRRLRAALAPDGWLATAPAEASAEMFRPLVPVNFPGAIFFASEASARPREDREIVRVTVPSVPAAPPTRPRPVPARSASERVRPESAADMLVRARALADRGNLQSALALCESALRRDRLDCGGHVLLAAIHQELGDTAQALSALRRALYLDPDSVEAHAALGHLLLRRGESRRARLHLRAAERLGARGPWPT